MTVRYYRRIIRIRGEDSPNVRLALAEKASGRTPSNTILVPGVLPWADYEKRRATWDKVRQSIGLDAEFWEGAEVLMYPPDWLNRAERLADQLRGQPRKATALGCDPGEGGDNTCWAVIDDLGLIDLLAQQTPDTTVITSTTIALMQKYNIPAHKVCFDAGGGGHQAVDRLRLQGYRVNSVAFGEAVTPPPKRGGIVKLDDKIEQKEEKYTYVNRRAEMYGTLMIMLDPSEMGNKTDSGAINQGFAIPAKYTELRRQLSIMPKIYDAEGRLKMLPKNKKSQNSNEKTLREILGCSPDEADAIVVALHANKAKKAQVVAGVAF